MPIRRLLVLMSVALLPLTAVNATQAPASSHSPALRPGPCRHCSTGS